MKNLLHTPFGVRDVIGNECKSRYEIISRIWKIISSYGYEMINTPTFEFADCFSREIGSTPQNELFRFFDRDGNTLALRPDFTPSIARVSAKYFSDSGVAIKLGYAGSVFKNHNNFNGKLSESVQLGAEYIGDDGVAADAEIIAMSIQSLLSTGLDSFVVSLGHSDIFNGLCTECGFNTADTETLRSFITNKNFFALEEFIENKGIDSGLCEAFKKSIRPISSDEDLDLLLDSLTQYKKVHSAVSYLKELKTLLSAYDVIEYVSLDLSIISEYRYYTGVIFNGYTYGSGSVILSGGRYNSLLKQFGKDAPAIGYAIYFDNLMEALIRQDCLSFSYEIRDVILYEDIHRIEAIKNASTLRKKGKKVLLVNYKNKEELEKYKQLYENDNLFLITDGKE